VTGTDAARDAVALVEAADACLRADREGDRAARRQAWSDIDVILSHGDMRAIAIAMAFGTARRLERGESVQAFAAAARARLDEHDR
jgi:hypothetical protein